MTATTSRTTHLTIVILFVLYSNYDMAEGNITKQPESSVVRCPEDIEPTTELWVKRVIDYSSQYDDGGWSAKSIEGPPEVYPRYGDINGAWAQGTFTNQEYVTVEYDEPLYLCEIEIYETLNAGAVSKISGLKKTQDGPNEENPQPPEDEWVVLWQSSVPPSIIRNSRIFKPNLSIKHFFTDRLKLELDCSAAQTWSEIDSVKIRGKRQLLPAPPPLSELSDNLSELVNNTMFSDVTFDVDGKLISAHRAILSVRSQYFRAMFCSDLSEANTSAEIPIVMEGVSHSAFLAMIQYLYTQTFSNTMSPLNANELMRVADRFSLDGMKGLSYRFLCQTLSIDNVIDLYVDAVQKLPTLDDVEKLCITFISSNLYTVTNHPSFSTLSQDLMLNIIQAGTAACSISKKN